MRCTPRGRRHFSHAHAPRCRRPGPAAAQQSTVSLDRRPAAAPCTRAGRQPQETGPASRRGRWAHARPPGLHRRRTPRTLVSTHIVRVPACNHPPGADFTGRRRCIGNWQAVAALPRRRSRAAEPPGRRRGLAAAPPSRCSLAVQNRAVLCIRPEERGRGSAAERSPSWRDSERVARLPHCCRRATASRGGEVGEAVHKSRLRGHRARDCWRSGRSATLTFARASMLAPRSSSKRTTVV